MEDSSSTSSTSGNILNIPKPPIPIKVSPEPTGDSDDENASTAEVFGEDGKSGKLTLATLIQEDLIQAGEGVLTIDYLGQTFKGDLSVNGQIRSQETSLVFNNPSAWAIYCKKIVNPAKKSGCGWASVKYKGRKMDHYKNAWLKTKLKENKDEESREQLIVKHGQIGLNPLNKNALVEMESFPSSMMQPFTVSVSSSALLIIDLHSHTNKEVVYGYLAGQWDLNAHNLAITHAFPCLLNPDQEEDGDNEVALERAQKVELGIYNEIYSKHLILVGWYRSLPNNSEALPSLKDCENQLEYQVKMLGHSDGSYTPCVGVIASTYGKKNEINAFWVLPPPDPPNGGTIEYGKPMLMNYHVVADPCLSQETLNQIDNILQHARTHDTFSFHEMFDEAAKITYITKLGSTIVPRFPRDQDERLWRYIRNRLLKPEQSNLEDPILVSHQLFKDSQGTTISWSNGGGGGGGGGSGGHEEEEEIDDDEENALKSANASPLDFSAKGNKEW